MKTIVLFLKYSIAIMSIAVIALSRSGGQSQTRQDLTVNNGESELAGRMMEKDSVINIIHTLDSGRFQPI